MAEVWAVEDMLQAGDRPPLVALKVIRPSWSAVAAEHFRREFSLLAAIRHPNVAAVFDYGRLSDGRAYYTAELAPGEPLSRLAGTVPLAQVYRVAAALCRVLDYLGARGILHNDVKPSNVLVAPSGGVKLLDFGVAGLYADGRQAGGGTPPYMSPERLRGLRGDERSDLYSLGVTLWKVLTGALPFDEESPPRLLELIETGAPPARALRRDCPPALDDILRRLLSADAHGRPARGARVIEMMVAAGLGDFPLETPGTRDAYAFASAFVGRDREIEELLAAMTGRERHGAPLVILTGPAGAGKSRLLRELRQRLQFEGKKVIAVRCAPGDAPFGAMIELLRVARHEVGTSAAVEEAAAPLDDLARGAAGGGAFGPEGAPALARLADAAGRSLEKLALIAPFVAVLDDFERADAGTQVALAAFAVRAQRAELSGAPGTLLAAVREGHLENEIAAWTEAGRARCVRLPPLDLGALRRLLDSLFGSGVFGEAEAAALLRRSAGSPLVVQELVRGLLRSGGLEATGGGFMLKAGAVEEPTAEGDALRDMLKERMETLGPDAQRAARALAVLGTPSPVSLVAAVAGPAGPEEGEARRRLDEALARLEADGLLLWEPADAARPAAVRHVGLFHEAFAQEVLAAMDPAERSAMHVRAGEALSAAGAADAVLARHFVAAGDAPRAFRTALAAGRQFLAVGQNREALAALRAAEGFAVTAGAGTAVRLALDEALGDALAAQESAAAASGLYARALGNLPPSGLDACRIIGKAAWAHARRHETEEAARWLARIPADAQPIPLLPEIELARLQLLIGQGRPEEALDAYRRLLGDPRTGPASRAAERLRRELAVTEGLILFHLWRLEEALSCLRRARDLARAAGDIFFEARAEAALGVVEDALGDHTAAAGHIESSRELAERSGDRFGVARALQNLAINATSRGDYQAAESFARRAADEQRRVGVSTATSEAALAVVLFLRGDVGAARELFERAMGDESRTPVWVRVEAVTWLAVLAFTRGDEPAARACARKASELAQRSGSGPERGFALAAEAFAHASASGFAEAARGLLSAREAFRPPIYRAATTYGVGVLLERAGDPAAARTAFERAAGELEEMGNHTEARRARAHARDLERRLHPEGGGTVDLIRGCAEAAAEIGQKLDRPAIAAALTDASLALLGAERALVIACGTAGLSLLASTGAGPALIEDPLVGVRLGRAEADTGPRHGPGWLAVPLETSGSPVLALYAEIARGPSPETVEVARLLARQAGNALRAASLAAQLRTMRVRREADSTPTSTEPVAAASRLLELSVGMPTLSGHRLPEIVGESAPMCDLRTLVERIGRHEIPVLVTGETGTGKELVARALHRSSPRAGAPFVAVNCASIPTHLAESELFGHARGAFTGAVQIRTGLFEEADGGTLLLDEIGDLEPATQAKFLRVLEDGVVRPLGGRATKKVDVRVVAATNRNLAAAVEAGRFRLDLYHRLSAMEIQIPPLRERPDDLLPLVRHFLGEAAAEAARGAAVARHVEISAGALDLLRAHDWPGNVRELENELRRAWLLSGGGPIRPEHLSERVRAGHAGARSEVRRPAPRPGARRSDAAASERTSPPSRLELGSIERAAIVRALERAGGNKTEAARLLGITRRGLRLKMKRYGVEAPPRRREPSSA